MACFTSIKMTLIIGQYAINWYLNDGRKMTVTARALEWKSTFPTSLVLPHPSPRNNRWLKTNHWFEQDVVPTIKT